MFVCFVYTIQSKKTNKYYIGVTSDINKRIKYHNGRASKYTKGKGPWALVYKEEFVTKKEAWLREHQIKKYKRGEVFKSLINK